MKTRFLLPPLSVRYMLLSAIGFAFMGVCVKLASQRSIPVMEIVAARALISLILSYLDVRRKSVSIWGHRKVLLVARGVVGTLALMCVYYALTAMPLAVATVLQYLHPIFTALIAAIALKEKIKLATLICIVLSLLGLLFIARPSFIFSAQSSELSHLALAAALGGALGAALAYVLVRKLNQTEEPSVIIFYFPLFALPCSLWLLGSDFIWPDLKTCFILLLVGIFTQIGQIGLTKAMQIETAGKVAVFSYIQVLFATLLGWLVFKEIPGFWTYVGSSLILLGAVINLAPRRQ